MKKYDERFNERQIKILYYEEDKTAKEVSKIVNIPIRPLCQRMNKCGMELGKIRYETCRYCKEGVPKHLIFKHISCHIWIMRNNAKCKWCDSDKVVKHGFQEIKSAKIQCLLCRKCGRLSLFNHKEIKTKKRTLDKCKIALILRKSGYTFKRIAEFMEYHYKLKIDIKTAWNWVKIAEKQEIKI